MRHEHVNSKDSQGLTILSFTIYVTITVVRNWNWRQKYSYPVHWFRPRSLASWKVMAFRHIIDTGKRPTLRKQAGVHFNCVAMCSSREAVEMKLLAAERLWKGYEISLSFRAPSVIRTRAVISWIITLHFRNLAYPFCSVAPVTKRSSRNFGKVGYHTASDKAMKCQTQNFDTTTTRNGITKNLVRHNSLQRTFWCNPLSLTLPTSEGVESETEGYACASISRTER